MKTLLSQNPQRTFAPIFLTALFFFLAVPIEAIPLANYRENISEAGILLDSLQFMEPESTDKESVAEERATLREVRRLVPASQTIEFANSSIETDNGWLEKDLQTFEKMPSSDEKRSEFLQQITERLGAIEDRLTALETASTSERASSNENKKKLDEILSRAEFKKPEKDEKSILESWMEAFEKWLRELWYSNSPAASEKLPTDPAPLAAILRFIVIGVAIAVIGFIFWRFVMPMFSRNRKPRKSRKSEPRIVLGEQLATDATSEDLLSEAEQLARAGDVRAAIRKGYIALLCELSDRKILGLARHKTNRDYLRDVQKRPELHQPMDNLTGSFERHWYGSVPADENDWSEFRGKYQEAVRSQR